MIQSLLIGNPSDNDQYLSILNRSKYFAQPELTPVSYFEQASDSIKFDNYDAIVITSNSPINYEIIKEAIRNKCNIYMVDQANFNLQQLEEIDVLHQESGNMIFPENKEAFHPLLQDFIATHGSHLLFRYNKSVASKSKLRAAIVSALSLLSILSPMQIKNINVRTQDTEKGEKPFIKIRLKLYDSSLAYIMLKMEKKQEHNILLELKNGSYTFNFTDCYLENIHGKRFTCDPVSEEDLLQSSIDMFGMHIILNNSPRFTFHHYALSAKPLQKIQNILANTF